MPRAWHSSRRSFRFDESLSLLTGGVTGAGSGGTDRGEHQALSPAVPHSPSGCGQTGEGCPGASCPLVHTCPIGVPQKPHPALPCHALLPGLPLWRVKE